MIKVPLIIGLTGGIGSGKTAATNEFQALGVDIVDADIVARKVVEPGSTVLASISKVFGADYIKPNGQLDRAKLRHTIFSDKSSKAVLNDIMQPAIRKELLLQLGKARSQYVILSAPLLFENGLDTQCAHTIVVDVPETLQVQRASNRDNVSEEQIKSIISSQLSRSERRQRATEVIDNSRSLLELKRQVNQLHNKYLTLSAG